MEKWIINGRVRESKVNLSTIWKFHRLSIMTSCDNDDDDNQQDLDDFKNSKMIVLYYIEKIWKRWTQLTSFHKCKCFVNFYICFWGSSIIKNQYLYLYL